MAIPPHKAQVRLDRAKAKHDKRLARLDRQETGAWFRLHDSAAKSKLKASPEQRAQALRMARNAYVKLFAKARASLDKKFGKAQAKYGQLPGDSSG